MHAVFLFFRRLLPVSLLVTVLAGAVFAENVVPEPKSEADARPKAEQPEALIARYLEAHEQQNILAALRLVYMEDTPDFIKRAQEQSFRGDFEHPIKRVKMEPAPDNFATSYTVQGKKYVPTLPVVAVMQIEYELAEDDPAPFQSVTYPVGVKDGKWWIVSAKPAGEDSAE